jgi:hypothetical protein
MRSKVGHILPSQGGFGLTQQPPPLIAAKLTFSGGSPKGLLAGARCRGVLRESDESTWLDRELYLMPVYESECARTLAFGPGPVSRRLDIVCHASAA